MEIGIVGLPNVGKSTLFNALTSGHAASSNYPFTTIDPNVGVVSVPDARLNRLAEIFKPEKLTPATIKFVDIAGLVKGASHGAGLGNQFLSNIREVDAIVQVVRLFEDPEVVHTLGSVDPLRDIEIIETELGLADLQSVEKQIQKVMGGARTGDKESKLKWEILERIRAVLNNGRAARLSGLPLQDLKPFFLLTAKPILYVSNEGENGGSEKNSAMEQLQAAAQIRQSKWIAISAKIESEIAELSTVEEKNKFREALGFKETGLEKLIRESYRLLDLITFFTAGPKEVRAWTLSSNSTALTAAGQIHTDIAKGFIRAEIYRFEDVDRWESEKVLQEKGLVRSEGKEYPIADGDICYFHFR